MPMKKHRVALLVGGFIAAATSAGATTLLEMSFDAMVADADTIIVGEATDARVVQTAEGVYTITTFAVEDSLAGSAGAAVEVAVPGGIYKTAGSGGVLVREATADAPMFAIGSEQLLFLDAGAAGALGVVGFSQGAINVVETARGKSVRLPGDSALVALEDAKARVRAAKANRRD